MSARHTVFAALDVARFEAALTAWVRGAGYDELDEKVLHILSHKG